MQENWIKTGHYEINLGAIDAPPTLVPGQELLNQLELGLPSVSEPADQPKIGVHLHAFHIPESEFILTQLLSALPTCDLLITSDSREKLTHLEARVREANWKTDLRLVANRGRNVLPFLQEGLPFLKDCDLALHLHSKRSDGGELGERWLSEQLEHLVGDRRRTASITTLFKLNPALGLLMPRPPLLLRPYLGWGANGGHAKEIVRELWPHRHLMLQAPLVFPAGMMFWFRPAALKSLAPAAHLLGPLPPEPIPADGTTLHAIERLIAHACEDGGLRWALIGRGGQDVQLGPQLLSVWEEKPETYQNGICALAEHYRQLQGENRRLTEVEHNLRDHVNAITADYMSHLAAVSSDHEKKVDHLTEERDKAQAELVAIQQTLTWKLIDLVQNLWPLNKSSRRNRLS